MTTIIDVATRAGVSFKTVSRVMNGEPNVRESTRKKVLDAARDLDFQINGLARSLRSKHQRSVAMIVSNPASSYAHEIQLGALRASQALGVHLFVEKSDSQEIVSNLGDHPGLTGLILGSPQSDKVELVRSLKALERPIVRLATELDIEGTPRLSVNERQAACDAVTHLVQLGHRRIAFINGPAEQHTSTLRLAGFEDALSAASLPTDDVCVRHGAFDFQSGFLIGDEILTRENRPTAIFAANDDMAAGCLAAAYQRSIRVPDELSIVGFDDSASARLVYPNLTTIRQPTVRMAEMAVEWLFELRQTPEPDVTHRVLPHELIERKSSAPPPLV